MNLISTLRVGIYLVQLQHVWPSHRHNLLKQHLNVAISHQNHIVPGLWKHDTHPIQFTLVVINFGVKYTSNNNVNDLIALTCYHYVSVHNSGKEYVKTISTGTTTMAS